MAVQNGQQLVVPISFPKLVVMPTLLQGLAKKLEMFQKFLKNHTLKFVDKQWETFTWVHFYCATDGVKSWFITGHL